MKTSWNETRQIDAYISGSLNTGGTLLFEARMLLDPALRTKVLWQKNTLGIVRQYGRLQLKKEIEAVHQQLFTDPEHTRFSQKIRRLFINQ